MLSPLTVKVINHTPCPAAAIPNAEAHDVMTVLFVVACTVEPTSKGLRFAAEQAPLLLEPDKGCPDDVQFMRRGVSVTASGFVYPPGGKPAPKARARLTVGEWQQSIDAFGPRVWQRAVMGNGLTPTAPRPVERIAMSWDNAYGGSVFEPSEILEIDGEPTILPERAGTYPYNFDGTGFYLRKEQAEGQPLPSLENPDDPIRRWDDRPEPVCFAPYPLWGGLRIGTVLDPKDRAVDLSRIDRLTGRACPRLSFERIEPGTRIELEGMRPHGAIVAFEVPAAPARVEVRVGDATGVVDLQLDCIDIDAEARTVRLVYRHMVQYGLVRREPRSARFVPTPALAALEPPERIE